MMQVPFTFMPDEYCQIHLGDDEWGNEVMERVAKELRQIEDLNTPATEGSHVRKPIDGPYQ